MADLLGHSEIRVTMDLYSHVAPALQREAADQMDATLAPKSPLLRASPNRIPAAELTSKIIDSLEPAEGFEPPTL